MNYSKVDNKTGEVLMLLKISTLEDIVNNEQDGQLMIPGHAKFDDYYKDGAFVPRPDMKATINKLDVKADNNDCILISGLPNGNKCFALHGPVNDFWGSNEESLELVFNIPGEYALRISQFPYLDLEARFNVKA